MVDEKDAEKMFETIEEAREHMEELEEERDQLLRANRMLVEILIDMEDVLEEKGVSIKDMDSHTYSFHDGWRTMKEAHQDRLTVEDLSLDTVEGQIDEIKKLMGDIENL